MTNIFVSTPLFPVIKVIVIDLEYGWTNNRKRLLRYIDISCMHYPGTINKKEIYFSVALNQTLNMPFSC